MVYYCRVEDCTDTTQYETMAGMRSHLRDEHDIRGRSVNRNYRTEMTVYDLPESLKMGEKDAKELVDFIRRVIRNEIKQNRDQVLRTEGIIELEGKFEMRDIGNGHHDVVIKGRKGGQLISVLGYFLNNGDNVRIVVEVKEKG